MFFALAILVSTCHCFTVSEAYGLDGDAQQARYIFVDEHHNEEPHCGHFARVWSQSEGRLTQAWIVEACK